jgi:hypothetical protein
MTAPTGYLNQVSKFALAFFFRIKEVLDVTPSLKGVLDVTSPFT